MIPTVGTTMTTMMMLWVLPCVSSARVVAPSEDHVAAQAARWRVVFARSLME